MTTVDTEAERCAIGCVIWDAEKALARMADELPLEAFADSQCRAAYKTALGLWREGVPVDMLTLAEKVGGDTARVLTDLNAMQDAAPSPANLPTYISIIQERWRGRQIRNMAQDAIKGLEDGKDLPEILTGIESALNQIGDGGAKGRALPTMKELARRLMERTQAEAEGTLSHLPTGFMFLDRYLKCRAGELIIVAARPSVGKSAFALNIAERMSMDGTAVGIFSLEMADIEMAARVVQSLGRVSLEPFANRTHTEADFKGLSMGVSRTADLPIWIDDTPSLTCSQLRSRAKAMKRNQNIGALFVDYLQLADATDKRANKTDQIGEISRTLKLIAKELGIPVFGLSQLSRDCEKEKREPRMSDLRSSGDIEQDADKVLLLHPVDQGVKVIIAKQRGGRLGGVILKWFPEFTRFEDMSPVDEF